MQSDVNNGTTGSPPGEGFWTRISSYPALLQARGLAEQAPGVTLLLSGAGVIKHGFHKTLPYSGKFDYRL